MQETHNDIDQKNAFQFNPFLVNISFLCMRHWRHYFEVSVINSISRMIRMKFLVYLTPIVPGSQ